MQVDLFAILRSSISSVRLILFSPSFRLVLFCFTIYIYFFFIAFWCFEQIIFPFVSWIMCWWRESIITINEGVGCSVAIIRSYLGAQVMRYHHSDICPYHFRGENNFDICTCFNHSSTKLPIILTAKTRIFVI
jgi:hypothetical protein